MRFAAIDDDGRATGALYDTTSAEIVAHHAAYGETLIPVADLVNTGTDDAPVWEVVPPSPQDRRAAMTVSRFQARAALRVAGLFDAAEAAIAASADPILIEAWASASEFRRTSPSIAAMGAALGLTDEQVDDLFDAAARIEA